MAALYQLANRTNDVSVFLFSLAGFPVRDMDYNQEVNMNGASSEKLSIHDDSGLDDIHAIFNFFHCLII